MSDKPQELIEALNSTSGIVVKHVMELEQQLAELREGIAAIYGDAVVPDGLPTYEVVKMSPTTLIKHCKALLPEEGK